MDIRQLRYFSAVVRAGSFTRAAEQLGITPLFERLGRSIRLTPHGEALVGPAAGILQKVAEAHSTIAGLNEGVRGQLRVGVIPTVMPYWIAPRIREYLDRFPDVELALTEETTAQLIQRLQSGDLDLAISGLPVRGPDIICSELFREPLFLAVAEGHRLSNGGPIALSDLRKERLLLLKEGHCLREDALMACTRPKAKLPSIFETDQMASIFQLVRASFGVTVVPAMAVSHSAGCKLLPLRGSFRRVGYLRAKHHVISNAMREFISWLRKKPFESQPKRVLSDSPDPWLLRSAAKESHSMSSRSDKI